MRRVLIMAVVGMLSLLLGIFLLISGNLTLNSTSVYLGFAIIAAALGLLGWSVVLRNRGL